MKIEDIKENAQALCKHCEEIMISEYEYRSGEIGEEIEKMIGEIDNMTHMDEHNKDAAKAMIVSTVWESIKKEITKW